MNDLTQQLTLDDVLYPEIKKSFQINQSPVLINMRQNLNITERRIIYSLMALVQPGDQDFKSYVIRAKDLADLIGISEKSFYERLEHAINSLMTKQLVLEDESGRYQDRIQWVQRATYIRGKGLIRIKLSDDLKEFLLTYGSYTKYRLLYVLPLRSEYSWRIYEFLKEEIWKTKEPIEYKKKQYTKYRVMKVSELRKLLDIPDDQMTLMKNFRAYVLNVAKKELAEKTDIKFEYDVYKKIGRNIDSFIFYIEPNKKNMTKQLDIDTQTHDIQSILHRLINFRIRREKAVKIIETYTLDYIDFTIRYAYNTEREKINFAGYLIAALENNYGDYPYETHKGDDGTQAFNNMILTTLNEKLSIQTQKDVSRLSIAIKKFNNLLSNCKNEEELFATAEKRKTSVFHLLDEITLERKQKDLPNLTLADIPDKDPNLKTLFSEWESTTKL